MFIGNSPSLPFLRSMTSLKKPTFSHILLSAPTEDIAEVYRAQLAILRDSVPFLREVEVNCVSDPEGQRVGSGGGTLNGLAFLRNQYNLHTPDACRILIIHSGGESRRAPLYSLCGKAWTTINATLEGGEIASPIGLLIAELSKFCVNLPLGSLVIASSDVMLDIVVDQISAVFEPNSVSLVTVPAKPTIAKNHGVIVAPKREDCPNIPLNVGLIQSAALNYLQKPSVKEMEQHSALYTIQSFGQEFMQIDSKEDLFALVDTGVVVFTGAALGGLVTLMESSACAGCIAPAFLSTNHAPRDLPQAALRLELYTDLLLALRYSNQEDFSLALYYTRLGVPMPSDASRSAYDLALAVVWETLKSTPLQMILAPSGKFEHLGTTAEVLQLLTQQCNTSSSALNTDEVGDMEEPSPSKKPRTEEHKLQRFAHKYGLCSSVDSNVSHPLSGAVVVNSTVSTQQSRPLEEVLPVNLSASEVSGVLLEHSLLVDMPVLPSSAVVSHLCAPVGRDLRVQNDVMMQQIYLKQAHDSSSNAVDGVPFTLLVMGIRDDTKVHFSSSASTLCGASWDKLFQIAHIQPDRIWDTSVPIQDRCLWNARLFCASILDANGAIFVHSVDNTFAPASRLTLTWLQDLPYLSSEPSLPAEYVGAVQQWVTARRLSLADILTCGDATRMMQWRVWLQSAHAMHYHATGRVYAQLGGVKITSDLSKTFMHLLKFEQTVQQNTPVGNNVSAVLLGHWLAHLARNSAENAQNASSSVLQSAFVRFCEQMRSLGNPRIYHVISAYLKKLLLKDVDVTTVLKLLLEAVPNISANMHARVLFLCAWLVKDRNYYPASALSTASINDLFRSVMSESKLRGSSSFLKACGEKIIATSGVAILLSIQQSTSSYLLREGESLSVALERGAQGLVALHLQHSLDMQQLTTNKNSPCINENTPAQAQAQRVFAPRWGVAVESLAPVRIDLAGGWSDTPPICYELSGAVLNVSVLVDNKHPIRCVSKMIAEPVLELHSTSLVGAQEYITESICIDQWRDFEDLSCSGETKKCLLLRAVLVALGVVDIATHRNSGVCLSEYLQNTFGGGISVTCVSDLPAGSGMGGSSILAAAALHSLSALLGLNNSRDALVSLVSQVEQLLTTGGGWQDQVGGIFGGFKLCECPAQLPLSVNVQTLAPGPAFRAAFERRVWLVYTGQQRLARNTLINALRYSALSPADTKSDHSADCPGTVAALVNGAHAGWKVLNGDCTGEGDSADDHLDCLSAVLNSYWELKTEMAAGSEPPHIAHLLSQLRPLCSGLSLCGAGAGGFASVVLRRDVSVCELRKLIDTLNAQNRTNDADLLSLHTVSIDCSGICAEEQPLP